MCNALISNCSISPRSLESYASSSSHSSTGKLGACKFSSSHEVKVVPMTFAQQNDLGMAVPAIKMGRVGASISTNIPSQFIGSASTRVPLEISSSTSMPKDALVRSCLKNPLPEIRWLRGVIDPKCEEAWKRVLARSPIAPHHNIKVESENILVEDLAQLKSWQPTAIIRPMGSNGHYRVKIADCTFNIYPGPCLNWDDFSPQLKRMLSLEIPDHKELRYHLTQLITNSLTNQVSHDSVRKNNISLFKVWLFKNFVGSLTPEDLVQYQKLPNCVREVLENHSVCFSNASEYYNIADIYIDALPDGLKAYYHTRILLNNCSENSAREKISQYQGHGFRPDLGGIKNLIKVVLEHSYKGLRKGPLENVDGFQAINAGCHGPFFAAFKLNHPSTLALLLLPEEQDKQLVIEVLKVATAKGGLTQSEFDELNRRIFTSAELLSLSQSEIDTFFV